MIERDAIQRLTFAKYSGVLGIFSSHTEEEKALNALENEAVTTYNRIHDQLSDERYADRIKPLWKLLDKIRSEPVAESAYESTRKDLEKIIEDSTKLRSEIRRRKMLDTDLAKKLDVSEDSKGERAESSVTPEEFEEIRDILDKIYVQESSVVRIELESGEHFDLAKRSQSLELPVSKAIATLETRIRKHNESIAEAEGELRKIPPSEKGRFGEAQQKLWALLDDPRLDGWKSEYLRLVREYVRDQTMKDLVTIAQTGVGRTLLKTMTQEKYRGNAEVLIASRDFYGAPTGGPSSGGKGGEHASKVLYTPQALRARDTLNRGKGKALDRMEALKETNPWQENTRTDITLFHELVHARHVQQGTLLGKDKLIGPGEAVHPADKPFAGSGLSEGEPIGVPKEEYQTVGLGEFAGSELTENAYRKARRGLGEEVAMRTQYVHVDAEGRRVADESAM